MKIIPTFWKLHPRKFQNEYTIGIATTSDDDDQYEAEGFEKIERDLALSYLSRRPEDGESLYITATVDGVVVEDRFLLARHIRRAGRYGHLGDVGP